MKGCDFGHTPSSFFIKQTFDSNFTQTLGRYDILYEKDLSVKTKSEMRGKEIHYGK